MKTNSRLFKWLVTVTGLVLATALTVSFGKGKPMDGFVAHEWGTFTSVQGADGVLMDWRPLETADLPKFVYDRTRPGFDRKGLCEIGKSVVSTLQRMETPVIYFYSDEELTAEVSVKFPRGTITEWYPQARQIGPATVKPPQFVAKLDYGVHKLGVNPGFTFASLLPRHAAKDSRIVWSGVRVLPAGQHEEIAHLMPLDQSGSHYFAARETDAAFVRVKPGSRSNPAPEHERFLFYRGVGSFSTPLVVTMDSNTSLTISNQGPNALGHAFVLNVRDGKAQFLHLDRLDSNTAKVFKLPPNSEPRSDVAKNLGDAMANALVSAGLFKREAVAMVNTWKDSWFADEGLRVLYLLPTAWTDATLPLEINPRPQTLVRVMVGRAEVITPEAENQLREQLTRAQAGDAASRSLALGELKKLGRFAQPAVQRVTRNAPDELFHQFAWALLQEAGKPNQSAGDSSTRTVAETQANRTLGLPPSAL